MDAVAASDDEDGGEGEEFVAAAAVDVQVGVEEAVLVEKDDRQAVMPEEPVKIVALGVAFVVPPSRPTPPTPEGVPGGPV